MKRSVDRLLTTHVGRLQRPDQLTARMDDDPDARPHDDAFRAELRGAVRRVVREQVDAGVDIVDDGEFGKLAWIAYLRSRLGGFEPAGEPLAFSLGPDRVDFKDYYDWAESRDGVTYFKSPGRHAAPIAWQCTGPIEYTGHDAVDDDIQNLKAAVKATGAAEAFMPATAPGITGWTNAFYESEEEYLFAVADALREEYQAIVEAGLVLHIDDPMMAHQWTEMLPGVVDDVDAFHRACALSVEALNYALRGIPPDRVRFHICWGSWHGPHTTDAPLAVIMPMLLKLNVGAYLFEAANVRHEHEWELWGEVGLPEDRILVPGVVSHATSTVEHPELIARRLLNFASVVGRERVIAGTDCGLGYRVHPQIAWAKLRALSEGAALASERLWP